MGGGGDVLHERHDRTPKGVVYSHRSTILHALGVAATSPLGLRVAEEDVILPVVPMFHANAWGYPYLAALLGCKIVVPGPAPRPGEPARGLRPGARDVDGRGADDLARDARRCSTPSPGKLGSVAA